MSLIYIPEEISARLITHELAVEAVRAALIAAADGRAVSFPTVLGHGSDTANRFSIKSAATNSVAGLKVGSYWRQNLEARIPAHSSCILLFDQTVGRIDTVVEANGANAFRTAAADALAVDIFARKGAERLAVFGAGHQAWYECAAVMRMRPITEIYVVNRDQARAQAFASRFDPAAVSAIVATGPDACAAADIIVTATASTKALFESGWIRPGVHISCMGADARGKQELPRELLLKADLYCDLVSQSVEIGEFQHIRQELSDGRVQAQNLGDVLAGKTPGKHHPDRITIFDSSGLALQDLFLAARLVEEAERRGLIAEL